ECDSSGALQVLSYEGSAGSDFLWVDGAPSDPAIRTKIRSHVRKDGLKKLKESRKKARLPRYPSLKSAISSEKLTARSNGSSSSLNRPRLIETDCAEDDESQRTAQTHLKDS